MILSDALNPLVRILSWLLGQNESNTTGGKITISQELHFSEFANKLEIHWKFLKLSNADV